MSRSLLVLAATFTALCGCQKQEAQTAAIAGETQPRELTRVRTTPLEAREMVRTLTTTTVVESENEITIFPRVGGNVIELRAEEGDRVQAGQALAVLDQRQAKAAVAEARIALREAEENVPQLALAKEEAKELFERAVLTWEKGVRDFERNEKAGLISQQELDQLQLARDTSVRDREAAKLALERAVQNEKTAETAIERAKLVLQREELNLSYTEIVAPFDGVVATRSIKAGDAVSTATEAFVLTDPTNLRAVFFRPQRELPLFLSSRVSNGSSSNEIEIAVTAEAIPGKQFLGEIQLVSPTIDAASGSFRVTVNLDQPATEEGAPQLLPGMLVRLEIITDRRPQALTVPKRALTREGDANFLFTVKDGVAHRVRVEEGFTNDELVEVIPIGESLTAGELVVVVGNRDLEEGSEVESTPWGEAAKEDAEPAPAAADEALTTADTESSGD